MYSLPPPNLPEVIQRWLNGRKDMRTSFFGIDPLPLFLNEFCLLQHVNLNVKFTLEQTMKTQR